MRYSADFIGLRQREKGAFAAFDRPKASARVYVASCLQHHESSPQPTMARTVYRARRDQFGYLSSATPGDTFCTLCGAPFHLEWPQDERNMDQDDFAWIKSYRVGRLLLIL